MMGPASEGSLGPSSGFILSFRTMLGLFEIAVHRGECRVGMIDDAVGVSLGKNGVYTVLFGKDFQKNLEKPGK